MNEITAARAVIVDDTEDLRDLLRFALTRAGYDVVADVGDGLAGIEAVREHRPDVVLLDLSMPVMDGMTALPRIRELAPRAKIIVFSGFGATQLAEKALANGADDYLQKGASMAKIIERVRTVLAQPAAGVKAPVNRIPQRPAVPAEQPSRPLTQAGGPLDALVLAPYGVLQVGAERPHAVLWSNPVARSLLDDQVGEGATLAQFAPELAGVVATHRLRREGVFGVRLGERICQVTVRHAGASLFLYLEPSSNEVTVLRTAIASTAHEMRGPVAVLGALAETITEGTEAGDLDDDHLLSMTASIGRQAKLLDSITADLLTTAQVHRGTLKVTLEIADPRAVVEAAAEDRGLAIARLDVTDHRPVLADPLRLEQMLTNLLGNAYNHGEPPVFVRIRPAGDPAMVCIDVIDSGPGVPPEFRDRLFTEFARAEATTAPGTGLGLHVVRTLAQAQGGQVSYAPAPGGGAQFSIALPTA